MNYTIQKNSRRSILMAAALMCSVLPLSVGAQNWPDKPIKIVVPAPGVINCWIVSEVAAAVQRVRR